MRDRRRRSNTTLPYAQKLHVADVLALYPQGGVNGRELTALLQGDMGEKGFADAEVDTILAVDTATGRVTGPHTANPCKMPQVYTKMYGPGRVFYQDYFGEQTGVIREIESDLRGWLRSIYYTVSGEGVGELVAMAQAAGAPPMSALETLRHGPLCMPEGAKLKDAPLNGPRAVAVRCINERTRPTGSFQDRPPAQGQRKKQREQHR